MDESEGEAPSRPDALTSFAVAFLCEYLSRQPPPPPTKGSFLWPNNKTFP